MTLVSCADFPFGSDGHEICAAWHANDDIEMTGFAGRGCDVREEVERGSETVIRPVWPRSRSSSGGRPTFAIAALKTMWRNAVATSALGRCRVFCVPLGQIGITLHVYARVVRATVSADLSCASDRFWWVMFEAATLRVWRASSF